MNTFFRRASALACLTLLGSSVVAQAPDQEKMKANYADMLTHDWFTQGGWMTDFAAAKAKSAETGKPLFAYFTRTYAA